MNRNVTNKINWVLDNLAPPLLRDSKWFMSFLMLPLFKGKTKYFLTFKDDLGISDEENLIRYYKLLDDVHIKRETDLNEKSISYIMDNLLGRKVLDIACGTGHLVKKIALSNPEKSIVGIDFNLDESLQDNVENATFKAGSILDIGYNENHFDTVICAHTLEHLYDPKKAVDELRRVASKRLIIVLPKQREYKYTFDLHLHFFPYEYTLYSRLGIRKDAIVSVVDGDYVIVENY